MKKNYLAIIVSLCVNFLLAQAYLGIYVVSPTNAELRTAGLSFGVKVDSVVPGSPADQAGLTSDNIIFRIDNVNIRNENELTRVMSMTQPKQTIIIHYVDNKISKTSQVTLNDRNDLHKELYIYNYIQNPWLFIGFNVEVITPSLAELLKLETGMVILSIRENSLASIQGLETGDIIISIDNHKTNSEKALTDALNRGLQNQPMTFSLWRNSQIINKSIDLSNSLNTDATNSNVIFIIGPDVFDSELYGYTREQINSILNKSKSEFENDIERLEEEIFKLRQRLNNNIGTSP